MPTNEEQEATRERALRGIRRMPSRIAVCSHPDGTGDYVPLDDDEPVPTTCHDGDCDCHPVLFVRAIHVFDPPNQEPPR